ncbi:transporter substrate-binding domain-containing protein [Paraburkholderia sp. CNPSo 3157]|uniref:Sensory/regulatory protein RpfC n=1 Tax=Paraburkholderia franconis TaxID=2654983 RepID=A0A7X1NI78_9BURK|nr:transporter substrate-binding domain-containing protein [Paraburkholderia franconis]MPW21998.1 transporter substrate-binding domain-containing protein [Paraburkholderia franconis]
MHKTSIFRIRLLLLLLVTFAVLSNVAVGQTPRTPPQTTPANVTVGVVEEGWPPIVILNNGQLSGAAFDFLKAVLDPSTQVRVQIFPDFESLNAAVCAGSVDIVLGLQGPGRPRPCLVLSDAYFDSDVLVVGRASDAAAGSMLPRLAGKRIATEAGSYIERVSHDRYPESVFVHVPNPRAGLSAVLHNDADVYITLAPVVEYALSQPEFAGLAEINRYRETESGVHFGFPRARQMLRDTLNERLNALPADARQRIVSRWMSTGPIQRQIAGPFFLTDDERAYLRSLPPLRVAVDTGLAPYAYVDEGGEPHGMALDYLRYLADKLGITFVRQRLPNFAATVNALQSGKLDLIAVAVPGDSALHGIAVSRPYATYPVVVVGARDTPAIGQMRELDNKRVAVTEGGGLRSLVISAAPQARIIAVPDIETGMDAVAQGTADVYVDDLAAADYMLQRMHGGNLRVIGSDGPPLRTGIAMTPALAARLMPLVNRALASMPDTERLAIQNRYFTANYVLGPSWRDIATKIAPFAIAMLAVIAVLWRSRRLLRKEAQVRREAELRLIDVTSQLPATAFQFRRAKNRDPGYTWLSGNSVELFGKTSAELQVGASMLSSIHPDDRDALLEDLRNASQTLTAVSREVRVQRHDAFRWTRLHAVPQRADNGDLVWNGYWSNAEQEHEYAAALAAARDAAEQASRAKSDFLATMSHEIRTPMSAVLGLIELLAHSDLRPDQTDKVKLISQAAESLLQILNDILDYSKIEAGKIVLERAPVDIRELCTSSLGLLFWRAQEKGLRLGLCIDAAVAPVVWSDGVRLRQILFNLLSNAIKFTTEGSVKLDIELADEVDGVQTVVWRVTDTGIGVSAEQQAQLFQPFVQAEASTTRRFGGTGLGLSICRRVVDMLGGTIGMEGEIGRGTRVEFRVPLEVCRREFQCCPLGSVTIGLRIRDAYVLRSLAQAVRTLGGVAVTLDPNESPGTAGTLPAQCQLIIDDYLTAAERRSDELLAHDRREPAVHEQMADVPVIPTTAAPKSSGYLRVGDVFYLGVYPVTLQGVSAVCNAALHGDAELGLESPALAFTPVVPRSRDDALRQHVLILVAEDNPINRHLIRQQLELLGCTCDAVEDGAQALGALESADYALLITDCHMPQMDGYTLATRIRAREDGARRMPIVGLTASVGREERGECVAAGMDDCLYKPAKLSDLVACIARFAPQCLPGPEASASQEADAPNAGMCEADAGPDSRAAAAGMGSGPVAVATEARALPDLDWSAINQSFGSSGRDEALIAVIAQTMVSDADELQRLLDEPDTGPATLRQWIHRVDGGASVLRYEPLKHALQTFRASVLTGDPAQYIAAGERMLRELREIARHLARQ